MRTLVVAKRRVDGFASDGSGNFGMIGAIIAAMLTMAVGFAVNLGQAFLIKSSMREALDAAVTSTARDITTGKIEVEDARASVDRFLQANSNAEFAVGRKFNLTTLTVDRNARTIEATAQARVALAFPVFSVKNPSVSSTSAAIYSDRTIEVSMMLDVTGSMAASGKKDKIGDLRKAATNAVNLMLDGQDPKNPRIRIALIPYAEAVNIGDLAEKSSFVELPGGPDLPPLVDEIISIVAPKQADTCATERKDPDGLADFSDDGPDKVRSRRVGRQNKDYLALVNRDDRVGVCPKAELVPLTADKKKLLDSINDFRANGVTAGGIAAQWGYYMLSPKWQKAIKQAKLGDGPAKHDARKVAKIAILMTDGQFNTAFANVTGSPQMQQGTKSRAYAEQICTNMKKDGIEVFTIGFDLDDPKMGTVEREAAKGVLKNCSTPDAGSVKHYFEASTGAELDAAFAEIIRNTERLALTR